METLNKISLRIFVLFLLFAHTNVYGFISCHKRVIIDTVRITYGYLNGYGMNRSIANYLFHQNVYELLTPPPAQHSSSIPKTISENTVTKFYDDYNRYAINNCCDFIKITTSDYDSYIKITKVSQVMAHLHNLT